DSLITIQGTVIDEKNNPLAGVLVTVDGQSDITDNNGKYVIQNVPIGAKTIVAKKESPLYKSAIILKRGDKIMTNDIIITSTIPAPTPTPSPTPTTPPTLTPCIIDTMDSTSGWRTYKDDKGSSINIKSISGRTDNAIEISYDLKEWGWLVISKKINPEILSEKEGIKFFYKGSGEPNTIELKLIYGDVGGTTFGVLWNRATVADNWVSIEVPYSHFDCWWPDDNCLRYGNKLDLKNVRKIEFAISNKQEDGDMYGSGRVIIDDVQGICPSK
ncbi:MAG: carboxypeptidase regulatory-like domain-containing protein, partial [Thermoplasmatales archaeon]|nr:carboxypeptidase regulatory-like domain-containing protein [Thermoplasmatales archaeon]